MGTGMSGASRERRSYGPEQGADLKYEFEISLEDAYHGIETEIDVPRLEKCSVCSGTGAKPGTKPKGCPKCGGIGYKGRGALMEILLLDDDIKATILKTSEATEIRKMAVQKGMATLRDVGLQKVRDGITTIDEIIRVTGE